MPKAPNQVYDEGAVFQELALLGQTLTEEDRGSWRGNMRKYGVKMVLNALNTFVASDRYDNAPKIRPGHLRHIITKFQEQGEKPAGLTEGERELKERYERLEAESFDKQREHMKNPANWCSSFCHVCGQEIEKGTVQVFKDVWFTIKRVCSECRVGG